MSGEPVQYQSPQIQPQQVPTARAQPPQVPPATHAQVPAAPHGQSEQYPQNPPGQNPYPQNAAYPQGAPMQSQYQQHGAVPPNFQQPPQQQFSPGQPQFQQPANMPPGAMQQPPPRQPVGGMPPVGMQQPQMQQGTMAMPPQQQFPNLANNGQYISPIPLYGPEQIQAANNLQNPQPREARKQKNLKKKKTKDYDDYDDDEDDYDDDYDDYYEDDDDDDDLGIGPRRSKKKNVGAGGGLKSALNSVFGRLKKNENFNDNYDDVDEESDDLPGKSNLKNKIADFLFYSGLVILIITAFYYTQRSNGPVMIFNHSFMTVLTPSMQREIPQGSLILVKKSDPGELKVGDVITFMKDAQTSWTHTIINIYDNYNNTGKRGFQTKGVNNPSPDQAIVYEDNVVGRLVFHIPFLGWIFTYIGGNIYIVFLIFGILMICSFVLRGVISLSPEVSEEDDEEPEPPKRNPHYQNDNYYYG
jgi:signal peptidase